MSPLKRISTALFLCCCWHSLRFARRIRRGCLRREREREGTKQVFNNRYQSIYLSVTVCVFGAVDDDVIDRWMDGWRMKGGSQVVWHKASPEGFYSFPVSFTVLVFCRCAFSPLFPLCSVAAAADARLMINSESKNLIFLKSLTMTWQAKIKLKT